jgi:signal transduction histidine kinase
MFPALHVPALAPLGGTAGAVFRTNPAWTLIGVALLALRYRRTDGAQRRQIRWLLFGITASLSLWIPAGALWQLADPDSTAASVAAELLSGLAEVTTLGSVLGALFYTGVFGIDEPARRAFVHRVLRVSIGVVLSLLAVVAGVLTSLAAPVAVAVAVAVAAVAAGQAVRPRLEQATDRWVLGARLAGYASLSRLGERLTRAPGSAELLRDLAGEIRRDLDLTWTRVSLQPPGGPAHAAAVGTAAVGTAAGGTAVDGTAVGEPAAVVPIEHRGIALGRIECGPRTDGPLLAEDRRLLAYFAAQAAVGVHNLYLAAELAASRNRIVAGQDAERRRIQAVLHDGVQQEIVALSAKAGLVRQQLLRGDAAAAEGLAGCSKTWPRPCRTSGRSPTRSIRPCCPTVACSRPSRLSPPGSRCRWRSAPTRACAACGSRRRSRRPPGTCWPRRCPTWSSTPRPARSRFRWCARTARSAW